MKRVLPSEPVEADSSKRNRESTRFLLKRERSTKSFIEAQTKTSMPIIMHIDMDAFYASVEEAKNPTLKGKPLIIGSDPKEGKGRGVVATCNYKARAFGVRSAMAISEAYKRCPHATFLQPIFKDYTEVSQRVMSILKKHSNRIEQVSIDEAYLDLSDKETYEEAKRVAQKIKEDIKAQEKITCSIGIGPNKVVAKIGSDLEKPDGLTSITEETVLDVLGPLPIRALRGVGPKAEEKLKKLNITTVEQLRAIPLNTLEQYFGSFGQSLYNQARGKASATLTLQRQRKSIGKEHTFIKDTAHAPFIEKELKRLAEVVSKTAQKKEMKARTITLKLRYEDFTTLTRSKTVEAATDNKELIFFTAQDLFRKNRARARPIRLIGVALKNLMKKSDANSCNPNNTSLKKKDIQKTLFG